MKLHRLRQGDIVEVEWIDATQASEWITADKAEWPEMQCRTVGYYWKHSDRAVMLMGSLFEDYMEPEGTVGGLTTIPLGWVTRVSLVRRDKPPEPPRG